MPPSPAGRHRKHTPLVRTEQVSSFDKPAPLFYLCRTACGNVILEPLEKAREGISLSPLGQESAAGSPCLPGRLPLVFLRWYHLANHSLLSLQRQPASPELS